MRKICLLLFALLGLCVEAQVKDSLDFRAYTLFENDSLILKLDEVYVLPKLSFKARNDKRYYYWFRKKVLRAYPFAKSAAKKLSVIDSRLDSISSKRKRKKYIKRTQKYLEKEFTPQLKKLTRTEGRVLIKLLHRETGSVTFDLIKEYRNGWKAFWSNATANLFKMSLKDEYDPLNVREDYMIEDILQRAWRDNLIELEAPKIDYDFLTTPKRWNFLYPTKK
jgi:hypothetical protein